MSYCRWSSDCWYSDVYVYEAAEGIEIHVAFSRYVSDEPRPILPPNPTVIDAVDYLMASQKWVKTAHTENIGLPMDGRNFSFAEWGDAIAKLVELTEANYYVPGHVIDALVEELKNAEVK